MSKASTPGEARLIGLPSTVRFDRMVPDIMAVSLRPWESLDHLDGRRSMELLTRSRYRNRMWLETFLRRHLGSGRARRRRTSRGPWLSERAG